MREIVLDVAASMSLSVVDFGTLAERLAPDGIPGDELFLDHVHPGVELHRALAPRPARAHHQLGQVLALQGRYRKSALHFERIRDRHLPSLCEALGVRNCEFEVVELDIEQILPPEDLKPSSGSATTNGATQESSAEPQPEPEPLLLNREYKKRYNTCNHNEQ